MRYAVAVRELCAFTAKTGDLDLRFTPAPTAQEGIAGHQLVVSRRPAGYAAEVGLSGAIGNLQVRGRADGVDRQRGRLEEIKTHHGDAGRIPENHRHLHLAQAETYAHLLCSADGRAELDVAVVYFEIRSQAETATERRYAAAELATRFAARCERFAAWAMQETAHRRARDDALAALAFPHPFRSGQRDLAAAVYRCARDGRHLLAQAPTGIGKTLATLFPALKALAGGLDKVYFLTAKTAARGLALAALRTLAGAEGVPLRVLELGARETLCEHPDKACHGDSCPLARGFYDRLPAARSAAVGAAGLLDRTRVAAVARAHAVCPYYLAQELIRWSDVVIGDSNHYFDTSAVLHGMTLANEWKVAVLVDEAHNLVERSRTNYSGELSRRALSAAVKAAPPAVAKPLRSLQRRWQQIDAEQSEPYRVLEAVPPAWVAALSTVVAAIAEWQAEHADGLDGALLDLYFAALHLGRLIESCGTHSIVDCTQVAAESGRPKDSVLCVRNVVPGPHLVRRYASAHSVTLFSATLAPMAYYRRMLGLPDDTRTIDVASPFAAEQLAVRVARDISTRYRDRARSLAAVTRLIEAQYRCAPGNYIAFFGSFEYLEQAADDLSARWPDLPVWRQSPRMDRAAEDDFLARFRDDGAGIGFAVLGGRFGEGIDLPGRRLVGAFIATLGMPQVNPVNEQMRRAIDALFGQGYEYAYLYPGLRKVVQAAGRVIRTTSDRGVVHLMDDRFAEPRVLRLLPTWWQVRIDRGGAIAEMA
ncbi:MAG: ATP-dependent DNA helicase [Proteobacteria bacterium]|nr:ATP-dependent DNA helicase [Pseudomonadota bacterium]